MIKHVTIAAMLLLLSLPSTAISDDTANDHVYVGGRQSLEIAPDRQLTLGRNIQMMLPNPAGTHIAFVTAGDDDNGTTTTLSTIGVARPQIRDYFTSKLTSTSGTAIFHLDGWSRDGRFLAFTAGTATGQSAKTNIGITDFVTGQTVLLGDLVSDNIVSVNDSWQNGDLIAFSTSDGDKSAFNFYYPKTAKLTAWPVPDKNCWIRGWLDSTHLLFRSATDNKLYSMDITTGSCLAAPKHTPLLDTRFDQLLQEDTMVTSSGNPLTLMLDPIDGKATSRDNVTHPQDVVTMWVSVLGAPQFTMSSRKINYLAVDSFLVSDGDTVSAQFIPHQAKASTSSIALLVNGNIYISSLSFGPASVQEALDAGEQVPCAEEAQLAASDLKQLGLGILQYSQDYDNILPRNADFHDEVYPYIKSESIFSVGKYPIKFSLDGEDLSTFDSPSTTVAGTITLPCAKVVLYLDGHVQSYPLQSTSRSTSRAEKVAHRLVGGVAADCGCRG